MLVTSVWLIYSNHNLQDNHVYTFLRRNLCRTITLDYIKLRWVHLINRRVQLGCNLCVLETGYKCLWMRLFGLFIILCARIYTHGCFQESVLIASVLFWHFHDWFGRLLHIISTLKQDLFFVFLSLILRAADSFPSTLPSFWRYRVSVCQSLRVVPW